MRGRRYSPVRFQRADHSYSKSERRQRLAGASRHRDEQPALTLEYSLNRAVDNTKADASMSRKMATCCTFSGSKRPRASRNAAMIRRNMLQGEFVSGTEFRAKMNNGSDQPFAA